MPKSKLRWQDMFNDQPDWAVQERAKYLQKQEEAAKRADAERKNLAIISAMEDDMGQEFDDAAKASMLEELRSGKSLKLAMSPEEEAAPVLPSPKKPTPAPAKATGLWDTIQEGAVSLIGRADAARESGNAASATVDLVNKDPSVMRGGLLARLADIKAGKATKSVPIFTGMQGEYDTEEVPLSPKEAEREAAGIQRRLADIDKQVVGAEYKAEMERLRAEKKASTERAGVATEVAKGAESKLPASVARATRVVGSNLTAEQAISTVAPIAAAVVTRSPAATAAVSALANIPQAKASFANAFQTAIEKHGATQEEATAYAGAVTAIEFGSETVGGALGGAATAGFSFLKSLGGKATKEAAEAALEKTIKSRVSRFATGQALDAAGEAASVLGQRFLDTSLEGTDYGSEKGQAALKQANEDFSYVESLTDAVIGSVGVGGVPGAIGAQTSYKADVAAQNERTVNDVLARENARAATAESDYNILKSETERVQEEERIRQENFSNIDKQREAEAAQKALEEEAGFQTIERDANAPTSRVEKYAGVVERVPVNPAAAITPEQVVAQREQAAIDAAKAEQEAAEQARKAAEAEAAARLEKAQKRITLAEKRQASAAKAAETRRVDGLALQVAKEHADKTPEERARILAGLIATPDAKPASATKQEKTPEERVQGVINQVEGLRKRQNSQRVNNRIRSLYRQDPTRTAEDIVKLLSEQEGTPTETDTVEAPTEEQLKEQIAKLDQPGDLDMAGSAEAAALREADAIVKSGSPVVKRTAEQEANYRQRVTDYVKALPNNKEGVAIRNLIKQGKVIITDRNESVGMPATNAAGTYYGSDGQIIVRLNALDPKAPKASLLSAVVAHEGGHAGQFNQREGRSNLFKHLLGDKGNAAANKQIRELAKSGNKLAQSALAKAVAASQTNKTAPAAAIENIEIVPYLFSEAKQGKFAPGLAGKIIRDVKVAARQAARKLGADLEFSLDELVAAGDKVAEEIVATNVKPGSSTANVDMIGGASEGSGFNAAKARGETWTPAVDNMERYEFSDDEAEIPEDDDPIWDRLLNGETVSLQEALLHPELGVQYPGTYRDLEVKVEDLPVGVVGQFDGSMTITLSPNYLFDVAKYADEIRNTLLHETQHAIQTIEGFVPGANSQNFVSSAADAMVTHDLARVNKLVGDYELGAAIKGLPPAARADWDKLVAERPYMDKDMRNHVFVTEGYHKRTTDRQAARQGDKIIAAIENLKTSRKELKKAEARAFAIYQRDRGEAEARTVERRSRMTPEQRKARPFESQIGEDIGRTADELFDSTPFVGRPERAPVAAASMDMAAPTAPTKPKPKFSVKERITRILSHGRQDRLDVSKTAEDLHSQMVDAIKDDTGQPVLTDEMDREFNEFLTHPDQGSVQGRARLIANLSAKYPQTTGVLVQMRDLISDITADTIREMVSTGRPLTVDQRKSIATMLANKDTYMSRAYAAFQGAKGRKWAETRWNNFYKNLGKDAATIKDDKKRLDVLEVRGAIKAIVDGLRVPDETALQDMPMDKLVSLAERHNIYESQLVFDRADPDAPWLKREELIAKLAEVKAAYPAGRLEDMAMDTAAELLGLGDRASNYAKQMSQLARDPGTLKKREHVPLEIRRLLGQIDAAPGAVLATLSNQAALRARAKVISEIVNDPNGDIAITQDDYYNLGRTTTKDRLNPRAAPTRSDYVHVTGDSWGVLKGMYVRKEAYSRMEEAVTAFHTWGEAMRLVAVDPKIALGKGVGALAKAGGAVNRWTKIPTVVYNPVNYFAQYMGSYLNMVGAGHLSGSAWVKGKAAAFDYIRGTAKTITTPRLSEVMRHMNLESADIAEIQKILGTKLEDYFDGTRSMQDARLAISKHATGLLGRAHKTQLAFYATADNWSKIANFYHRYEVLSAVNDASGKPKTDEQVRQEAGDDTSYTNISPERAHRLIQTAESAGVTQFAPYFAEVFRTRYTGFALAVKDRMQAERLYKEGHEEAANILARAATARFIGHTVATIGMPLVGTVKIASRLAALGVPAAMATAIANGVTALGADDEENKLKRRLMPEALRFQELISLGKDSRGYPIVWGSSQKIDPSGPMTDLLRIMAYADNDRTAAKALENYAYDNLLIVPQIWKDVYRGIVGDKIPESDIGKALDTVGMKSDFVKATGASPQQVDRYLNVLDNFIPGMLRAYKAQYSPEDLQADADTKKWANALNLMGFRFETFNPTVALKDYYRVSSEDKRSNSSKVNADLLNISQPDEATIISATERFFKSELSRQVEDYQNVKALKAHGFTDEQAVQLMKDGGYAEKDAKTLVEGAAVVSLSIKGLLEYANNSSAYMAEADKKERKTRVAQVANQIISMKDKLAELGIEVDESGIPKEWKE